MATETTPTPTPTPTPAPATAKIGFALTRIVVPLWILAGAAFKLFERTPSNLPSQFVETAKTLGIDLGLLLRTLISLEFLAIVVMVLVGRWARAMAIFMMSCFCLILINELIRQATSCGCFGSIKMHPGVMLAIDGALLLGVIFFKPPAAETLKPRPALAAMAAILLTTVLSYGVPDRQSQAPPPENGGADAGGQIEIPGFWYAREIDDWPGRQWSELDLFDIIRDTPADFAQGRKFVVLYRRDCDHCEEMFIEHFMGQMGPEVLAYRIPSEAEWPLPPDVSVTLRDLTDQCDWVVETPLVITFQDGEVVCAKEGEGAEECF
ncbi:MAG: MauE/DoxX family redox-associated membrane protein [Planctomycetota bacterium]|jgi:hypothetical protein